MKMSNIDFVDLCLWVADFCFLLTQACILFGALFFLLLLIGCKLEDVWNGNKGKH